MNDIYESGIFGIQVISVLNFLKPNWSFIYEIQHKVAIANYSKLLIFLLRYEFNSPNQMICVYSEDDLCESK